MKLLSIICTLSFGLSAAAITDKILIITHAFNRPEFIKYQAKTFKAFLQDKYEFVVFNDAQDPEMVKQIQKTCKKLQILCVDIPQQIHRNVGVYSKRVSNAIEYSLIRAGYNHDGVVFIIDSDMFLIKPLHIKSFLGDCEMYGCRQCNEDIVYLWNGLLFMNMATLPNKRTMSFCCSPIDGKSVDTGGHLYYYLKDNPSIKLRTYGDMQINELPKDFYALRARGFDPITCQFIIHSDPTDTHCMQFHADDHFLHYRAGGNWMHKDPEYHAKKSAYLFKFLDAIMQ